jgi:hypothetical protein
MAIQDNRERSTSSGGGPGGGGIPTSDHIFESVAARDAYFNSPDPHLSELISGTPIFVADGGSTFLEIWGALSNPASYDNTEWVRGGAIGMTSAQIKTLYESNIDTNEFSDLEQTRLGNLSGLGISYDFDNTVSDDPPNGGFRFNNAARDLVTEIYVDTFGPSPSNSRYDEIWNSFEGFIVIQSIDSNQLITYQTTGRTSLNGGVNGWFTIPVVRRRDQGTEFSNGNRCRFSLIPHRYPSLTETSTRIISTKTIITPNASLDIGNLRLSNGAFTLALNERASNRTFFPVGYELATEGTLVPFYNDMGVEQTFASPSNKSQSISGTTIQFGVITQQDSLVTQWILDSNTTTSNVNVQVRIINFSTEPPIFDYGRATGGGGINLVPSLNTMLFPVPLFIPANTTLFVTLTSEENIDLKGQTINVGGVNYGVPFIDSLGRISNERLIATRDWVTNAINNSNIPNGATGRITSFSISGQGTSVNTGFTISGPQAFIFSLNNPSLFTGDLSILQGATVLSSSISTTSTSASINVNSETLSSIGDNVVFTLRGIDTDGNIENRTFIIHVSGSGELVYYGLSNTNIPASVDLTTLQSHIVGTGNLDISTGSVSAGQFFNILVPSDNDLVSIIDDIFNQEVIGLFTRSEDVRTVNSINYTSYVIGPLNADTTGETYTLSLT